MINEFELLSLGWKSLYEDDEILVIKQRGFFIKEDILFTTIKYLKDKKIRFSTMTFYWNKTLILIR